jgi:hypothetical protein
LYQALLSETLRKSNPDGPVMPNETCCNERMYCHASAYVQLSALSGLSPGPGVSVVKICFTNLSS